MKDEEPLTETQQRQELAIAELIAALTKAQHIILKLIAMSRSLEERVQMLEVEALDRISDRSAPAVIDPATPRDESAPAPKS